MVDLLLSQSAAVPTSSYATANKHATKSSHCKLRNLTK